MAAIPRTHKLALSAVALFLDVDGTLLEIAAAPQSVSVPDDLRQRLRALFIASGGAVALVSGRALTALDALFAPLTLPSAGLHGFERRDAGGVHRNRPPPAAAALQAARAGMLHLARRYPALLVEDKQFALALHYRADPQLEDTVVETMANIAANVAPELELQRGKLVMELRPAGATKARAVAAFMEEAPFAGRLPVFIGDDLTDEPAFELVNGLDGVSVVVSATRPSAARARLDDVGAVHGWLAQLQSEPGEALQRLRAAERGASGGAGPSAAVPRASRLRSRA